MQQLRACGVLETIRISAAGYPSRQVLFCRSLNSVPSITDSLVCTPGGHMRNSTLVIGCCYVVLFLKMIYAVPARVPFLISSLIQSSTALARPRFSSGPDRLQYWRSWEGIGYMQQEFWSKAGWEDGWSVDIISGSGGPPPSCSGTSEEPLPEGGLECYPESTLCTVAF